jgi:hypothetical protein
MHQTAPRERHHIGKVGVREVTATKSRASKNRLGAQWGKTATPDSKLATAVRDLIERISVTPGVSPKAPRSPESLRPFSPMAAQTLDHLSR